MNAPRIPRLVAVVWSVAGLAIAGLVAAVWHYLDSSSTAHPGMAGMSGMSMSAAHALTRGDSQSPLRPLFGSALFTAWQLDAVAVAVLVVAAAVYLTGVALVPVRSPGERWPVRRAASFLAGLFVCAFATNGSIAVYDQVLFTAHMAGHLALVMVAPALIMWGRPISLSMASASPARRARIERVLQGRIMAVLSAPPIALAAYALVIVVSHLTGLMDVIMRNTWAGQVEHLVYLLVGCQFFALVVGDEPLRWRLGSPARWLLLAIAMAVDTFVGIVLMQGTSAVGLLPAPGLRVDALSDTHTGGAIMWFGGDAVMAAIMIGLVIGWIRSIDTAPAETGWLEQARHATFDSHTGAAESAAPIDEDDSAHSAYNDWLAKLSQHG